MPTTEEPEDHQASTGDPSPVDARPDQEPPAGHRPVTPGAGPDTGVGPTTTDPPLPTPAAAGIPARQMTRFAWIAVGLIIVGVLILVFLALTDNSTTAVVAPAATSATVLAELDHVPLAAFDDTGPLAPAGTGSAPGSTPPGPAAPATVTPPVVLAGQPPLAVDGNPEVLYVGAEYCPFCAVERWPLIVALARFGTFSALGNMSSSPTSAFAGTATFTFVDASYSSPYLDFNPVELYSNAADSHGVYTRIAKLGPTEQATVDHYVPLVAPGQATSTAVPFVDIGNRVFSTTAPFSPSVLAGQSRDALAGSLAHPDTVAARAIITAANQLTAGICAATGQRPASVCSGKSVRAAGTALGLPG